MFVAYLLVAGLLSGGLTTGWAFDPFHPRTASRARAIAGHYVEIPFVVTQYNFNQVTISRNNGQDILSTNFDVSANFSDRVRIGFNEFFGAYVLLISSVAKSDEGIYSCTVNTDEGSATKDVELQVVQSTAGLRWDSTYRCGSINDLNGHPAECDPYGAYPCCSPDNFCGLSPLHCDCENCIDYRDSYPDEPPTPPCPLTYYRIRGRCLKALPEAVGLSDAPTKCEEIGAELALAEDTLDFEKFYVDPNAPTATRGLFWIRFGNAYASLEISRMRTPQWNWGGNQFQNSTAMEVSFFTALTACRETAERPSECDETLRRPICETASQT